MENEKEVVRSLGIDEKLQEFLPYAWLEDRRMTKDAKGGAWEVPGGNFTVWPRMSGTQALYTERNFETRLRIRNDLTCSE